MKIAIIGSGISGLTAAHILSQKHEVHVFEKDQRIGGHTATIDVSLDGRDYAIDTGFIVFNDWTYPNFIKLLKKLKVASQPTSMGFSVSDQNRGLEYSGTNLSTLFAQKRNWVNPLHWKMLLDIVRFNKEAPRDLEIGRINDGTTLSEYLKDNKYGKRFRDYYLLPMASAIWSTGTQQMAEVPVKFFVQFFKNHGLLSVKNRPQWHVIKGGSRSYLNPLTESFSDRIHCDSTIVSVIRNDNGVAIEFKGGDTQHFDEVIFATHSDQALKLLSDASDHEKSILGDIRYKENEVVLHTDINQLPKRKSTWSSWNYLMTGHEDQQAVLTYDMNILQSIDSDHEFLVTMNHTDNIDPQKILGRFYYSHPVFDGKAIAAQQKWRLINGVNKTWFCGAYWRNGFHEDGVFSALRICNEFGLDIDTSTSEDVRENTDKAA